MEPRSFRDTLLRGIALLGLILILVLGAWGIIVLAFNIPTFLSSAGGTVGELFNWDEPLVVNDDDDTIVVPVVAPTSTPATPTRPVNPSTNPQPTYTYMPAPAPVAQMYGLPDLSTRIIALWPQGNRYSMTFEISNTGTNIAQGGWTFNASLPLDPTYTYSSAPQQALRPGDKIVYTMGFNSPDDRYSYEYDHDERYEECGDSHRSWDSDDWFDWYQDAFDTRSDSREDWDEDKWDDWYDDFCDDYEDDRDERDSGTVRVVADPYSVVYEANDNNNTASQTINW